MPCPELLSEYVKFLVFLGESNIPTLVNTLSGLVENNVINQCMITASNAGIIKRIPVPTLQERIFIMERLRLALIDPYALRDLAYPVGMEDIGPRMEVVLRKFNTHGMLYREELLNIIGNYITVLKPMVGVVKRAAENAVKSANRFSKKYGIPGRQGGRRRKSRRNNRNTSY